MNVIPGNPRAVIGGNNPPLSPFEIVEKEINDLYDEAKLWLDGTVVDSQELADDIGHLLTDLRKAETKADAARVAEKAPYDEKIAEIQARYNALIGNTKAIKGKTALATDACKRALAPWLAQQQAEIERKAREAQEKADRKAREAQAAIRAAADAANLAAREHAETLYRDAQRAQTTANKAGRETAKAGAAYGRAASLRTTYIATVTDPIAFGKFAWTQHQAEYNEFLQGLANRLVRNGARQIPGVLVTETHTAV